MTTAKEITGEINKSKVINKGDAIKVIYFEKGVQKKINGVLISINNDSIEVNGTAPRITININNIFSIEKIIPY